MKKGAVKSAGGSFGGFGTHTSNSSLSYLAEPPSFTTVSNPHVVVALRNALKKDSTTKTKALEELLALVREQSADGKDEVETALLEIWIQIFPRISIDNSRRVRELAHTLQFELLKGTRKRMEKLLPPIVAPWLAGLFDRDRAVARAANAGLTSFLSSPEKMNAFWRKCQPQILDFAIEAIQETQDSLSDERSTTKEDAESKYYRVVQASLALVTKLLQMMPAEDMAKVQEKYDEYFEIDTVWASITLPDSTARKTVSTLLLVCIQRHLAYAGSTKARQAFVTGGLRTNQAGSALDYVTALTKLTEKDPAIWVDKKAKKSPVSRLQAFIAKGSQGSPAKYWAQLDALLQLVPLQESNLETANAFITSLKTGITHREEPRTNTSYSWKCFIDTTSRILKLLKPADQVSCAKAHLFPLFDQFIFAAPSSTISIPLGPNAMSVFVNAHMCLVGDSQELREATKQEWDDLSEKLCANISAGLPEVSKEFKTSQDRIGEEGRRWFGLIGEMQRRIEMDGGNFTTETIEPSRKILRLCIQLLQNRNLKPYGAGQVLEYALSTSRHLFEGALGQECIDFLSSVTEGDLDMLAIIQAPAAPSLLSSLRLVRQLPEHADSGKGVWHSWAKNILALPGSTARNTALATIIASDETAPLSRSIPQLQDDLVQQCEATASGSVESWDLLDAAITYRCLSDESFDKISQSLMKSIKSDPQNRARGLKILEQLVKANSKSFADDGDAHTEMVGLLLSLAEIRDAEVTGHVKNIHSLLHGHGSTSSPIIQAIQANLEQAGPRSLEIETLVQQAQDALAGGANHEEIFPSTNALMQATLPFANAPIDPAFSTLGPLGSAIHLVNPSGSDLQRRNTPRDSSGRSVPARMAMYVCYLLQTPATSLQKLPAQFHIELLYLLALVATLVGHQRSAGGRDGVWDLDEESDIGTQVDLLNSTVHDSLNDLANPEDESDEGGLAAMLLSLLVNESKNLSPQGYNSALILSSFISDIVSQKGFPSDWEERFLSSSSLKPNPEMLLVNLSMLSGASDMLSNSKDINNFCNRLISDVAGAKPGDTKTLVVLALLHVLSEIYEPGKLPVASNRIVFAVRQITSWFDSEDELGPELIDAGLRALITLMPNMVEVYGPYWEKTLEFSAALWRNIENYQFSHRLPLIRSSLQLLKTLESLPDPNDDLVDALAEFSKSKADGLIHLLRMDREVTSGPNYPLVLSNVDAFLGREVGKLPLRQIPDPEELYGLLASESREVQTTAFSLLHRTLPPQMEQQSIDTLIESATARLPDELLSLLLEPPTLEAYTDEALNAFPLAVRSYLLSWHLIFDAYSSSSFKIRNDFSEHLKAENHLPPLLDFMFDVLGHSAAHPLKLESLSSLTNDPIRNFSLPVADAEDPEKAMQWLLVHIYYLTLKYIPGLFRSWYLTLKSKQTKLAVESWTEKYFSPLIIGDSFASVQEYTETAEFKDPSEGEPLIVKLSPRAKEISAGYEVDDTQATMLLNYPADFPLSPITVSGPKRVAVSEKKWKSWIIITQGVITFANGNVLDGLRVLRRNVTGALKGHAECAICYAVLSPDQHVPNKQCGTCKNLFHKWCLYKWFQTSGQNTCPLCRNAIGYLGAETKGRR